MKNKLLLLITLILACSPAVQPQSTRDLQPDLSASFGSRREENGPGSVFGKLTNRSANYYPCVRIEFDLSTRFDQRAAGEPSRHLGVLAVQVLNVGPRSERDYQSPLPYPAGFGLKSISDCPADTYKPLPGNLQILSLTATPPTIQAGQTATLTWRTENAAVVAIGELNPAWSSNAGTDPIIRSLSSEPSGSLSVAPSQTTTYRLKAQRGAGSTYKNVVVTVTPARVTTPSGFCTISGFIRNDKPGYGTTVGLHRVNSSGAPLFSKRVTLNRFRFLRVPEGTYRVIPRGNYPTGSGREGGLAPFSTSDQPVVCQPNRFHTANFEIRSTEG